MHFVYEHRVRYRECDPMGVVYHAHYLDYFEYARTEALRTLGITYRELEERGIIMPVVEATVRYLRPAYYDDVLAIHTMFESMPRVKVPIRYEVRRKGGNRLLTTGKVVLCFVDRRRNRPIPAPPEVVACFEKMEQNKR